MICKNTSGNLLRDALELKYNNSIDPFMIDDQGFGLRSDNNRCGYKPLQMNLFLLHQQIHQEQGPFYVHQNLSSLTESEFMKLMIAEFELSMTSLYYHNNVDKLSSDFFKKDSLLRLYSRDNLGQRLAEQNWLLEESLYRMLNKCPLTRDVVATYSQALPAVAKSRLPELVIYNQMIKDVSARFKEVSSATKHKPDVVFIF